ncbi:MAG: hypothetical protein RLZZ387_1279 [Chloroflexota bacterium]
MVMMLIVLLYGQTSTANLSAVDGGQGQSTAAAYTISASDVSYSVSNGRITSVQVTVPGTTGVPKVSVALTGGAYTACSVSGTGPSVASCDVSDVDASSVSTIRIIALQ